MRVVEDDAHNPAVEFRRSRRAMYMQRFRIGFVIVVFELVLAVVIWGVIADVILGGQPPAWLHVAGLATLATFPFGVWMLCDLSEPTVMRLYPDAIELGGSLLARRFTYDEVVLLRLEQIEEKVAPYVYVQRHRVAFQLRRARCRTFVLDPNDIDECFPALRKLCHRAGALVLDEEVLAPLDSSSSEGRAALTRSLFWRFWRRAGAAIFFVVNALSASFVFFSSAASTMTGVHKVCLVLAVPLMLAVAYEYGRLAMQDRRAREEIFSDETRHMCSHENSEKDHTAAGTR